MLVVGCDIGRMRDYTAIAVLQTVNEDLNGPPEVTGCPETGQCYLLRYIERLRLKTSFADIVGRLRDIGERLQVEDDELHFVIDATGVGAPVLEEARRMLQYPVYGLLITGGDRESYDEREMTFHIPKKKLLAGLQAGLSSRMLRAAPGLLMMEALTIELQNLRYEIGARGKITFAPWKSTEHDDLVLSLAIAYQFSKLYQGIMSLSNVRSIALQDAFKSC